MAAHRELFIILVINTWFKQSEMKIYLAGPLFSEAEQNWLRSLKGVLHALSYDVAWPFELFNQAGIATYGTQVDDGAAWELGFACAKGSPAVGTRMDARYCGEAPGARLNAMMAGSLPVCLSKQELFDCLTKNSPVDM